MIENNKIAELHNNLQHISKQPADKGMADTKQRKKDILALAISKEVEKHKTDYIWLKKGKTTKLVNPVNLDKNLADGWMQLNIKK